MAELEQALAAVAQLREQVTEAEAVVGARLLELMRLVANDLQRAVAAEDAAEATAREAAEAAAAAQAAAEQLNPACTAFWQSRGYGNPPWLWVPFKRTPLRHAHHWPRIIASMKERGYDAGLAAADAAEDGWMTGMPMYQRKALRKIYDDYDVIEP